MKQTKMKALPRSIAFAGIAMISLTSGRLHATDRAHVVTARKDGDDDDKKPAKKERSFKNVNVVKVFPDMLKKTIHVVARSGNEKDIEFLVFDVNGNMVLDYKMKAGEKVSISNLKRGAYMYHVFSDDEYLTTGKLEFK